MSTKFSPRKYRALRLFKRFPKRPLLLRKRLAVGQQGVFAAGFGQLTWRSIETGRRFLARQTMRGRIWMPIRLTQPLTAKSKQARMGGGKGKFKHWVGYIRPGTMMYEVQEPQKEAYLEHRSIFTRMHRVLPLEQIKQKFQYPVKVLRTNIRYTRWQDIAFRQHPAVKRTKAVFPVHYRFKKQGSRTKILRFRKGYELFVDATDLHTKPLQFIYLCWRCYHRFFNQLNTKDGARLIDRFKAKQYPHGVGPWGPDVLRLLRKRVESKHSNTFQRFALRMLRRKARSFLPRYVIDLKGFWFEQQSALLGDRFLPLELRAGSVVGGLDKNHGEVVARLREQAIHSLGPENQPTLKLARLRWKWKRKKKLRRRQRLLRWWKRHFAKRRAAYELKIFYEPKFIYYHKNRLRRRRHKRPLNRWEPGFRQRLQRKVRNLKRIDQQTSLKRQELREGPYSKPRFHTRRRSIGYYRQPLRPVVRNWNYSELCLDLLV